MACRVSIRQQAAALRSMQSLAASLCRHSPHRSIQPEKPPEKPRQPSGLGMRGMAEAAERRVAAAAERNESDVYHLHRYPIDAITYCDLRQDDLSKY